MSRQSFCETIAPSVYYYANAFGFSLNVVPMICAQACLESRNGESQLSSKYFNYFGMTAGSSWTGDTVTYGSYTYRVYSDMATGLKGYFEFITSMSRYQNLVDINDPYEYSATIKADGWAEDDSYVTKLYSIYDQIKNYDCFDGSVPVDPPEPTPTPSDDFITLMLKKKKRRSVLWS